MHVYVYENEILKKYSLNPVFKLAFVLKSRKDVFGSKCMFVHHDDSALPVFAVLSRIAVAREK